MRLYYFSPAPFALSNLSLGRLKISRFADLNDPFELLAANMVNAQHREAFSEMKRELNESKGLICFSRAWSNPLLWGHYADKHTGVALGFDVSDHLVAEVIYADKRVRIEVDRKTKRVLLDEEKVSRLLRTKFLDWKYEDECRLFVQLDPSTRESGMYFQDFSDDLTLTEVILGPRCDLPIERIRSVLKTQYPTAKVAKARMAFKTFRVTEDRRFRAPNGDA
jgi:hypothetical protein